MRRILSLTLALATVLTLFTFVGVGSFGATEVFSAYVGDVYENVYADSYSEYLSKAGSDTSGMRSWQGFAWKGDEAVSRIDMFTRTQAYEDVTLVTEDFVNESGDVIKAENIGFTYLDAVTIDETMLNNYSKNGCDLFDVISGDTVRDMAKSTMYSAWVSMKVPEDAKAGVYNATLSAVSGGAVLAEFEYTLTVYDLVQPELDSVVDLWMWPYNSIRYYSGMTTEEYFDTETYADSVDWEVLWNTHLDEDYFPALESELELYAKAGGDTIFAQVNEKNRTNGDPYPSLVKWTQKKDGSFEFDYTDFDKWVELNLKHGIDEQIKCYDIGQFTNWVVYYNESKNKVEARDFKAGDIYWNRFNGYFIEDFIKHLDEKGWFDITYIALDEKNYQITKAVVDLVKKYTNKDGKTLKIATAVASWDCEEIFDDIYDLSIAYGLSGGHMMDIIADRNEKGLITTVYTCGAQGTSMINDPGQSAESIHHTYKDGATGFLRWALQKYNADPYKSSYNYNEGLCAGDCYLIYPSKDISEMKAYSTPRYEALCEAIRDIEKAEYLEENMPEIGSTVKNAFMNAQYADDFREVVDTYSAMLTSEGAVPSLGLHQSSYNMNIGDTVSAGISQEGVQVYEGQADYTYIDDSLFEYSDGWTFEGHYFWLFLYSTNHYTQTNNAAGQKNLSYSFKFYGDSFEIRGSKGRGYGQASVTVDGEEIGILDQYSDSDEKYAVQFSYDGLELGEHTVTVTGAGAKNPSAYGYILQVDYALAKVHKDVEWTTGNADVATVDENGRVTAVGAGTTVLTAKCGNFFATAPVTVAPDAAALEAKADELAALDLEGYPENVKADVEAALALSEKASTPDEIKAAYDALIAAEALTVSGIKLVNKPIVLTFPVGEYFTADGGRLEITRANGDKEYIFTTTDMASGYELSHAGTCTVTLTAYGKSVEYDITVIDKIDAADTYKDVKAGQWYESAVNYAVNHGLFNGVSGTTFEPNSPMNRAMLVTVLYRMEGSPSVEGITNPFKDVKANKWYTDPVLWAADNGIVGGMGGGKFAPNDKLTREQLATILYRYSSGRGYDTTARGNLNKFPDAKKVSSWAADAYSWANAVGLIGGNNIGGVDYLDPAGKATRAQVATILMRYQQNIV